MQLHAGPAGSLTRSIAAQRRPLASERTFWDTYGHMTLLVGLLIAQFGMKWYSKTRRLEGDAGRMAAAARGRAAAAAATASSSAATSGSAGAAMARAAEDAGSVTAGSGPASLPASLGGPASEGKKSQ
jgi:hypothetical protein